MTSSTVTDRAHTRRGLSPTVGPAPHSAARAPCGKLRRQIRSIGRHLRARPGRIHSMIARQTAGPCAASRDEPARSLGSTCDTLNPAAPAATARAHAPRRPPPTPKRHAGTLIGRRATADAAYLTVAEPSLTVAEPSSTVANAPSTPRRLRLTLDERSLTTARLRETLNGRRATVGALRVTVARPDVTLESLPSAVASLSARDYPHRCGKQRHHRSSRLCARPSSLCAGPSRLCVRRAGRCARPLEPRHRPYVRRATPFHRCARQACSGDRRSRPSA